MDIADLGVQTPAVLEDAAAFLVHQFNEPRGWPNIELARQEVAHVLREGFAFAALDATVLLGWVGGLPEYSGRVWELHPMVVRREHRQRGIGRQLAAAFEAEARKRGGLTATLGTDDDAGMTSLAHIDVYDNLPRHLSELRDL